MWKKQKICRILVAKQFANIRNDSVFIYFYSDNQNANSLFENVGRREVWKELGFIFVQMLIL